LERQKSNQFYIDKHSSTFATVCRHPSDSIDTQFTGKKVSSEIFTLATNFFISLYRKKMKNISPNNILLGHEKSSVKKLKKHWQGKKYFVAR
jgi:hypothetical protein